MKKLVCLIMVLLVMLQPICVFAEGQTVTSLDTGDRNVLFSDGYRGFCIDRSRSGAYAGDTFTPGSSTASATNNNTQADISQSLKIMFTQCFADIFTADGNGGYAISDTNTVQAAVWHFSDDQYVWGTQKALTDAVKAYTGPAIPDDGYSLTLDNGDVVTFSFKVMTPQKENQQAFFAYKLTVGQAPAHTHSFGATWTTDGDAHWHECECGEKADVADHSGGSANCITPAACETCDKPYGEKDSDTHTGNTEIRGYEPATTAAPGYTGDNHCKDCGAKLKNGEPIPQLHSHQFGATWTTDGDSHWHECECGEIADKGTHTYNGGKCTVCEKADPDYSQRYPDTGDGSLLTLWLAVCAVSFLGCIASLWLLKKKRSV